ncbi:cysteine--1-D-myo-inosityl 2-amino-2-deoxy-alpha-D-glucopyranoside ligase [Georgenia halophila]|uniref:L-cysteine:1D-myo-inositol 2-amino-2-deoxy-alpha-D-glucopyranoside ligase n=1 Tax=Georgenia halophila TaxID=620889 RepID=A0ABP8L550_9MICO
MHSWSAPAIPTLPGKGSIVNLHDTAAAALAPTRGVGDRANLYVCGITPYDATHLGHASTYLAYDLLVRAWRDAGRRVTYVQNVTDVDDPLLERATESGVSWRQLAEDQTDLFRSDMAALRVLPPDSYVGVVEAVDVVVAAVEHMLEEGTAYRVSIPDGAGGRAPELGDVYADLSIDPLFGTGARLEQDEMMRVFAENGGDPERPGKRQALDPLLWRRTRPGEPEWDGGVLGTGRPGWHIECACLAHAYLGAHVEVQGGGRDLVFPHHEMSESHLRMLGGDTMPVMLHSHAGLVGYDGEKMSKSRGNLVLVSRLVAGGAEPMAVRLVVLGHHYRSDWEYRDEDLAAAEVRLDRWRRACETGSGPDAEPVLAEVRAALADDLDAPRAVAAVDAWVERALDGAGDQVDGAPDLVRRTVDALLGVSLLRPS